MTDTISRCQMLPKLFSSIRQATCVLKKWDRISEEGTEDTETIEWVLDKWTGKRDRAVDALFEFLNDNPECLEMTIGFGEGKLVPLTRSELRKLVGMRKAGRHE